MVVNLSLAATFSKKIERKKELRSLSLTFWKVTSSVVFRSTWHVDSVWMNWIPSNAWRSIQSRSDVFWFLLSMLMSDNWNKNSHKTPHIFIFVIFCSFCILLDSSLMVWYMQEEEQLRNCVMLDLLYVHASHPLAAQIMSYYQFFSQLAPHQRYPWPIDTNVRLFELAWSVSISVFIVDIDWFTTFIGGWCFAAKQWMDICGCVWGMDWGMWFLHRSVDWKISTTTKFCQFPFPIWLFLFLFPPFNLFFHMIF